MKKVLVGLAFVAAVSLVQARSAVMLIEPDRVVLVSGPAALTSETVKQAIVRGANKQGWSAVDEQPGKFRLKFNKQGKHEVMVDVAYDASGFLIRYAGSTNMKYEMREGVAMIHPFYNQWVASLSKSISSEASSSPGL